MLMVKQQILQSDTRQLRAWAQRVVQSDDPALQMAQGD
jgi:phosphotransferase system enzyme I (PtsI)